MLLRGLTRVPLKASRSIPKGSLSRKDAPGRVALPLADNGPRGGSRTAPRGRITSRSGACLGPSKGLWGALWQQKDAQTHLHLVPCTIRDTIEGEIRKWAATRDCSMPVKQMALICATSSSPSLPALSGSRSSR